MSVPIEPAKSICHFDDIVVDCQGFTVFKDGEKRALPPRAFDVLRYLIAHRHRVVEKAELFEQVWKEKFVTDNALTRTIADIRHALGDRAESPRYVYTVPKRGYRFVATLTSPDVQGSRDTRTASDAAPEIPAITEDFHAGDNVVPAQAGARSWLVTKRGGLALFVVAVLVLGLGVFGAHLLTATGDLRQSVVAQPFVNTGGNRQRNSDSTTSDLSRMSGLKLMSPNAVSRYPVKEGDPASGGSPGVRTTLVGGLETTRQTPLVKDDEKQQPERTQTDNPEAYQLCLKGRYLLENLNPRDVDKSLGYFQSAIKLDPNYALAYVGLAEYYFELGGRSGNRPRDFMPLAKSAAVRAVELDGRLAEAHAILASILDVYERDWSGAEKEIQRARELNAEADSVRRTYIRHLAVRGRNQEALKEARRALDLTPLNVRLQVTVGSVLFAMRRYDEATQWFQKLIDADIYVAGSYGWLAQVYEARGLYDKAVEADLRFRGLSGAGAAAIATLQDAYASRGWEGYWRTALEQRKRIAHAGYVEPFVFAAIYARLGDNGQALQWLEVSRAEHSLFASRTVYDPKFDGLRSNPRFLALVREVSPPQ